ncbi:hypothetical protein [Rubrivirga sp.]|uniref:hypothetical protein n=1 Tax=Rubrivirga sp. TaxID=1885344 RepID=UPI003B520CC4
MAPRVAALLADELGHDEDWEREQVTAYRALASGYLLADDALRPADAVQPAPWSPLL